MSEIDTSSWEKIGNGIRKKEYTEPNNFIEVLEKLTNYYTEIGKGWAFRGHADSNWSLWPQSFRPTGNFYYRREWPFPKNDPIEQLSVEADILINFAKLCDQVGIQVPMPQSFYMTMNQWGYELKERFSKEHKDIDDRYIWNPLYHEPLAYAQHYGIPTRLLDLTKNPLYAAFFAVYDRLKNQSKNYGDHLCVWCLNLPVLKDKTLFSYQKIKNKLYRHKEWQRYKTIHMPWARNEFMNRQEAFFIIDCGVEFLRYNGGKYHPIDQVVQSLHTQIQHTALLKIELLIGQNTLLDTFKVLRERNITDINLMPTLQNISEAINLYGKLKLDLFDLS